MERKITRKVKVRSVYVGGDSPVSIQSMTNTDTRDVEATLAQIRALHVAGCEIIRCAVPDMEAAQAIKDICAGSPMPVVADIHFDYRLALKCVENGISAIRINPGNIGDDSRVKAVANICNAKNIPIRIGVNSGSLEKEILAKYLHPTPEALCESALYHAALLEKFDFDNIVISIKSSNVNMMIKSYELVADRCNYPLHLGVTEAGTERMGIIKSSIGIGSLLNKGIGDTIRVSLTADPVKEVAAGFDILKALGMHNEGIQFISCPTCGRTRIDLINLAKNAEERLQNCEKDIKVAIMGCAVNGPGEAKEADIGIAGGNGVGLIFKKGNIIKKVPEKDLLDELAKEIDKM